MFIPCISNSCLETRTSSHIYIYRYTFVLLSLDIKETICIKNDHKEDSINSIGHFLAIFLKTKKEAGMRRYTYKCFIRRRLSNDAAYDEGDHAFGRKYNTRKFEGSCVFPA